MMTPSKIPSTSVVNFLTSANIVKWMLRGECGLDKSPNSSGQSLHQVTPRETNHSHAKKLSFTRRKVSQENWMTRYVTLITPLRGVARVFHRKGGVTEATHQRKGGAQRLLTRGRGGASALALRVNVLPKNETKTRRRTWKRIRLSSSE